MSDTEKLAYLQRCREDYPFFAEQNLKVMTTSVGKEDTLVSFKLNAVQRLVHSRLEAQLAEKGWVRAMVLKGRRPGVSTYVAGRFYNKSSLRTGRNVYILAHEQGACDTLFGIVDRFQRNNPLAPHVGTSNSKELVFDRRDSSYAVATAGQKAAGRSRLTHLFHGSEVAFWPNASDHFKASIQTVSLVPGTEVILESTANGPVGEFHRRWQEAEAGIGDYIAIFIPWFLDAANAREPDANFKLSQEASDGEMSEYEIAETFGLTNNQVAWRRGKILELGSVAGFQQEYPATSQEAFVTAGDDPYISPILVMRAQKRKIEGVGPLVFGVDPAGSGGDRFAVAARRGMTVEWVKFRTKLNAQEGEAWVRALIDEHDPARVNIDAAGGGNGNAITSGLKGTAPKYAEKVRGVNFGGTSEAKLARPKKPGPGNRRAEMWQRTLEWLEDPIGAALPTVDGLVGDLCAPRKKPKLNGDFLLESKLDMKARQVRSPDLADAIALTFAFNEFITRYSTPAKPQQFGEIDRPQEDYHVTEGGSGSGGWMI